MTGDALRDEVIRLRRGSYRSAWPMGAALLLACALALVHADGAGLVWLTTLGLGALLLVPAAKDAAKRDAAVLALGDATALAYLRARLRVSIRSTSRVGLVLLALPPVLIGSAVMMESSNPALYVWRGAQFLVIGIGAAATVLLRRFARRPALERWLASAGHPPPAVGHEPWIAEAARRIRIVQGPRSAAFFWHEVTGLTMPAARSAVDSLPEPAPEEDGVPSAASWPPIDVVRQRVAAALRRDMQVWGLHLTIVAVLFVIANWANGRSWDSFADDPFGHLSLGQKIFLGLGGLTLLAAWGQWSTTGHAMKGNETSVRAWYRGELEKRLARLSKWSAGEIFCVVIASVFLAIAVVGLARQIVVAERGNGVALLVESSVFVVWFVVLPYLVKRAGRPRAQRELDEFLRADAPPPLTGAAA